MIDLSSCVRCGSCKAFCPTHVEERTEPMSARGRLVILDGLGKGYLSPSPEVNERLYSCALCGLCEARCPTGVDIVEALYEGRSLMGKDDRSRRHLRLAVKYGFRWPNLAFKLLRPLYPYLKKRGIIPFEMSVPEKPLRGENRIFKPRGASKGRVAVFTGCAVNYVMPSLGQSLINVLLRTGYEVILPPGEVCCGSPLRAMGLHDEAVELAKQNISQFKRLGVEAVVSPCPTCTLTIKRQYPELAGRGIENAMDISEFLINRYLPERKNKGRVFYHDPCHLASGLGVKEQPRELLRASGYEVSESKEPHCCGFSLSMTHGALSEGLLNKTLEGREEADVVVTACPACMLQLGRRGNLKVFHLISLL